MVRLKRFCDTRHEEGTETFNSIMVRLKLLAFVYSFVKSYFQFHYGSIKTFCNFQKCKSVFHFQFHYGSIKTEVYKFGNIPTPLSIPLWFD